MIIDSPLLTEAAMTSLESLSDSAPATGARVRSRTTSFSSCSTLTSLDESDLSDDDSEDDDELPHPKRHARGKAGGLPTPSPSDASRRKGKSRAKPKVAKNEMSTDGKAYLTAGLYWNESAIPVLWPNVSLPTPTVSFGQPAPPSRRKGSTKSRAVEAIDWKTLAPTGLFPPPMHYGETLLVQERSFRLPFDILRDFCFDEKGNSAVVSRALDAKEVERRENSRKPPPYRTLSKNIYVDRKPDKPDVPAICQCKPPTDGSPGCGEDCINRMTQYSCSVKTCPLGEKCTNKPLSQQVGIPEGKAGLRVIWTGNRGFGLKTKVPIKAGQFIMEYRGEIISRNESYRRVLTTYKDQKSFYFLDYDGDEVIDAGQRGNASRFINHSCGPNVNVVRWKLSDLDEYQMGIFALHDIAPGTELSYDYGWQDFGTQASAVAAAEGSSSTENSNPDAFRQRCYCGADVCSGWLGSKKQKEKEKVVKVVAKKGKNNRTKLVVDKVDKRKKASTIVVAKSKLVGRPARTAAARVVGKAKTPLRKAVPGRTFRVLVKRAGRRA